MKLKQMMRFIQEGRNSKFKPEEQADSKKDCTNYQPHTKSNNFSKNVSQTCCHACNR